MRKAYSNYSEIEPYTDGWVDTSYSGTGYSDRVRCPVVVDAEGSKNPFPFATRHNTEGYVLRDQRIAETKQTKVQFTSDWRAPPNYMGNPGTDATKYSDDSDHFWGKPSDGYPQTYKKTTPYYEKPSHPLSKPTNDIGTAVNFLTQAIKPMNVRADATQPNKVVPLSSTPWPTGTDLAAKDRKVDSDEDDWENPKEQRMYGKSKIIPVLREPTYRIDNKEGYYEKANNNKPAEYYEKRFPNGALSQQPRFPVPTTVQDKMYAPRPPPDIIDSSDARRRYGKTKSQQVPEDDHTGTIDSNEVVRKYKGTKVPW